MSLLLGDRRCTQTLSMEASMHRAKALRFLSTLTAGATLLLLALVFCTSGYAQVKPGDLITPENATKVKDLVAPGVDYKVERGMQMRVIPSQRVDWPPPYKDATEKYSSQVRLTQDHRSLLGYVSGQPFPLIAAKGANGGV